MLIELAAFLLPFIVGIIPSAHHIIKQVKRSRVDNAAIAQQQQQWEYDTLKAYETLIDFGAHPIIAIGYEDEFMLPKPKPMRTQAATITAKYIAANTVTAELIGSFRREETE